MDSGKILFRVNRKIVCYISRENSFFAVNIGKPSDRAFFSCRYDTKEMAEKKALQIVGDYKALLEGMKRR